MPRSASRRPLGLKLSTATTHSLHSSMTVVLYENMYVGIDANVCPLFKKGGKSIASNYRPISLTCILCIVLEHKFAPNLVAHLDFHQLLYDLQHGFNMASDRRDLVRHNW